MSRSPQQQQQTRRNPRYRDGGGGGRRARSRSPRFTGRDWKVDGISNDTQRGEDHLKKSRLFVGNVESHSVSRGDLISVFTKHGDVLAVSIHSGYSFVQMDSERSANRAINYEHGATLNGCKINVEFSSAALKAGARFRQLPPNNSPSPPPPPPHRDGPSPYRDGPPPSNRDYPHSDGPPSHSSDADLVERERRLQRILALERELKQEMTTLHSAPREDNPSPYFNAGHRMPPSHPYPSDHYGRRSPPPKKDYEHYSRRDSSGGNRKEFPNRPMSPRPRPQPDSYPSRSPNDRYGARYSGGYSELGRTGPSQNW